MSLGKARLGSAISVGVMILLFLSLAAFEDDFQAMAVGEGLSVGLIIVFVLLGISMISGIFFGFHISCPACNMPLGRGSFFADYCKHCGEKLD